MTGIFFNHGDDNNTAEKTYQITKDYTEICSTIKGGIPNSTYWLITREKKALKPLHVCWLFQICHQTLHLLMHISTIIITPSDNGFTCYWCMYQQFIFTTRQWIYILNIWAFQLKLFMTFYLITLFHFNNSCTNENQNIFPISRQKRFWHR